MAYEFTLAGLTFTIEKAIDIIYKEEKVGIYRPDFIVEDKILVEIKVVPRLLALHKKQLWYYIRGSNFKLGLLINFGSDKLEIYRRIFDTARTKRG